MCHIVSWWKAKKDLSVNETQALCVYLVQNTVHGNVLRGTVNDAAEELGVTRQI